MTPERPLPWDSQILIKHRREILGNLADGEQLHQDAEVLFSSPLSHEEADEIILTSIERYVEIRALARDLEVLNSRLDKSKGAKKRKLKEIQRAMCKRLEYLDGKTGDLPFAFSRQDSLRRTGLPAGEGLSDLIQVDINDNLIDELFPPLFT